MSIGGGVAVLSICVLGCVSMYITGGKTGMGLPMLGTLVVVLSE